MDNNVIFWPRYFRVTPTRFKNSHTWKEKKKKTISLSVCAACTPVQRGFLVCFAFDSFEHVWNVKLFTYSYSNRGAVNSPWSHHHGWRLTAFAGCRCSSVQQVFFPAISFRSPGGGGWYLHLIGIVMCGKLIWAHTKLWNKFRFNCQLGLYCCRRLFVAAKVLQFVCTNSNRYQIKLKFRLLSARQALSLDCCIKMSSWDSKENNKKKKKYSGG